jgi:hypothetical protein
LNTEVIEEIGDTYDIRWCLSNTIVWIYLCKKK